MRQNHEGLALVADTDEIMPTCAMRVSRSFIRSNVIKIAAIRFSIDLINFLFSSETFL